MPKCLILLCEVDSLGEHIQRRVWKSNLSKCCHCCRPSRWMKQILGVRQNLTFLGCWWAKDFFQGTVLIVHIVQIVLHNSKNNFQQVVGGAGVTFLLALRITVVGCLKETSWENFWNSLIFRWRLWGCSRTSNAAAAMKPAVVVNLDARFVSLSVRFFVSSFQVMFDIAMMAAIVIWMVTVSWWVFR